MRNILQNIILIGFLVIITSGCATTINASRIIPAANSEVTKYKTVAFVWIKLNRVSNSLFWGMGYWTRANAEFCILATKGHPKRKSCKVHQVVVTHIEEHSKKPGIVRDRIVELMGELPKIELFARQKTQGWDIWGNELYNDINMEDYK